MPDLSRERELNPVPVDPALPEVVVAGEILWDVFDSTERLGGAPLNFAAQARRLGHRIHLISALGADVRGRSAGAAIERLGLDTGLLQTASQLPTGTAGVSIDPAGSAEFTIARPAAYDAVELSERDLARLAARAPGWLYYGTLFAALDNGRHVLERLDRTLGRALKFYDLNLRPGADSPRLVTELMQRADAVKLNETELERVRAFTGLPADIGSFCRAGSNQFGWRAVAVTRGERGCVLLADGELIEAPGVPVTVVDTVGAGDAFAAGMMHGLSRRWHVAEIAAFANRIAATVASRPASLPEP